MKINPMRIQEKTDDLAQLLAKKNADYGNSFEEQFNEYGLTCVLIRLDDKLRRLKNLNQNPAQVAESIADTLQDIAGYAILAGILTENEKR